jgi:YihY family inner membrane protein
MSTDTDRDERDAEPAAGRIEPPGPDDGPRAPTDLAGRSWRTAIRRTLTEFRADNLSDVAAALTYYAVLSIFPGLLVLVAVVGLLGDSTTTAIIDNLTRLTPGEVRDILTAGTEDLRAHQNSAGIVVAVGLLAALWSASSYVSAFMRAANTIYDVPEGRPIWKTLPLRLGVTVLAGVTLVASLLMVVLTGRVAEQVGGVLGIESTVVTSWDIAKWPVLIVLVSLVFALLYWASPNARLGGFRWISPGSVLAVVLWLVASGLFAVYAANFSSYSRTYGVLASVIVFLVWLWLSNLALLLGAELDAELERQRAAYAGHPENVEPYLQLRDSRNVPKAGSEGAG